MAVLWRLNRHFYQSLINCVLCVYVQVGEGEKERESKIRASSEGHKSTMEAHCPACSISPGDEISRLCRKYILNFFYKCKVFISLWPVGTRIRSVKGITKMDIMP